MRISRLGLIFAVIYLSLVIASIVYALYMFYFAPINSEFAGLPSLLLTLPWSTMVFRLLDSVLSNSLAVTFTVISLCALLNACILYIIGAFFSLLFESKPR